MTTVHIRNCSVSNPNCGTLCGLRVHSPDVKTHKDVRNAKKTTPHVLNLVYSVTLGSANLLDSPDIYAFTFPKILPKRPILTQIQWCQGCWEHTTRVLDKLDMLDL